MNFIARFWTRIRREFTDGANLQRQFTIDSDYSSYSVVRFKPEDTRDIAEFADAHGVKHIRDIVKDMARGNSWALRNLRKYAYDILKEKSFPISDPQTGAKLRLGATYTFDDFQTIFFYFGKDSLTGIVASDGGSGFPLSTIILFDKKIIIHLTDSFWGLGERHFNALVEEGDQVIHERARDCDVCLVAGDANFAHYSWNELSALQDISEAGLDRGVSMVALHEPLGPANDLLGSHFSVIRKLVRARTPEVNRMGSLTFCPTGTFLNRHLVEKIIRFSDANLSPYAAEVQARAQACAGRSMWISVRTRNRTLGSQVEVLSALAIAYLQDRPDRMVIVDGHSLPFDHDSDANYIRELNEAIIHDDGLVADQILSAVKTLLPQANIVKFVGQTINESIAVGRHVGFYFCHHGTVQHKLGWFSSVPGLVHSNSEVLQLQPQHWVKQQSEVAALPTYIPLDLVDEANSDPELAELQKHLKHTDYEISNKAEIYRLVAEFTQEVERPA